MITRIIKLTVSLAFFSVDRLLTSLMRIFGKRHPGRCVVLYYHCIPAGKRDKFARQLDVLVSLARPVSCDAVLPLSPGILHAAVTFDDGFACFIDNALPELTRRRIPCSLFVPTGYLGQQPGWMRGRDLSACDRVASAEQLREISKNELVSIGSHCVTHSNLLSLEDIDAKDEIARSKAELEGITKRDVRLLSFPHGACESRHMSMAREAGYKRVFTISPTMAFSRPDEFATGRVNVSPDDWDAEFRLKLLGAYRWLPVAFFLKRKLRLKRAGSYGQPEGEAA